MAEIWTMIMADGTRHFTDLPQRASWYDVYAHVAELRGAVSTGFVTDHITEAWIDFTFRGYHFSINDQHGDYWFFVDDPACPDEILREVRAHFAMLLL